MYDTACYNEDCLSLVGILQKKHFSSRKKNFPKNCTKMHFLVLLVSILSVWKLCIDKTKFRNCQVLRGQQTTIER